MTIAGLDRLMMRGFKLLGRLAIFGCLLLLTGCLQYDLNIQFDSQTHGQLVQQLHWRGAEVLTNPDWSQRLTELRDRTAAVDGTIRFVDEQTLTITIPFNNGAELEQKFNDFFNPETITSGLFNLPSGEAITAHLALRQNNWFGVIFNHVDIQFDLTSVPDLTATRLPLLQQQQLLIGNVMLTAPWVRLPTGELTAAEQWALVPGQVNTLTADFWVPSYIGIGAAAIALFVLIGYGLKYWLRLG
ncbi:DUF3153 domain-containing protein [Leptolyngbya iicbica]